MWGQSAQEQAAALGTARWVQAVGHDLPPQSLEEANLLNDYILQAKQQAGAEPEVVPGAPQVTVSPMRRAGPFLAVLGLLGGVTLLAAMFGGGGGRGRRRRAA